MNAIFAMQRGVIALSGAEDDNMDYMGLIDVPVINIKPDSNQIFGEIEKLIKMEKKELYNHKLNTIEYVRNIHDLMKVSRMFIELYKN